MFLFLSIVVRSAINTRPLCTNICCSEGFYSLCSDHLLLHPNAIGGIRYCVREDITCIVIYTLRSLSVFLCTTCHWLRASMFACVHAFTPTYYSCTNATMLACNLSCVQPVLRATCLVCNLSCVQPVLCATCLACNLSCVKTRAHAHMCNNASGYHSFPLCPVSRSVWRAVAFLA